MFRCLDFRQRKQFAADFPFAVFPDNRDDFIDCPGFSDQEKFSDQGENRIDRPAASGGQSNFSIVGVNQMGMGFDMVYDVFQIT